MESNNNNNNNNATQGAYSTERMGESSRIFISHIKQYFASLPIFALSVIAISWLIALADVPGRMTQSHMPLISQWLYLSANKVLSHWQGHRILLYPLASPGFSLLITNTLLALPYMAAMERKHGTLKLAWLLITFYTCGIGLVYIVLLGIFRTSTVWIESSYVAGLSGWAVALSVWSAMEDESEGQSNDRMLFGVIRIPGRVMPYLIIAFYLFLVPDTSLLLHLLAAGVAFLYFTKRIPPRFLPSDDMYKHYEGRTWLERVTSSTRFVSMDAATSGYLPIHNATSSHISTPAVSHNVNVGGFPGQGQRLGDE